MGMFSWQTSDTKESIFIDFTTFGNDKPVYMLNPNGEHIKEESYDGYGHFGEEDAFVFLVKTNIKPEFYAYKTDQEIRMLGIDLAYNHCAYYLDVKTNEKLLRDNPGIAYDQLIESGAIKAVGFQESDLLISEYKPLKFSFNPDAVYDDLPAAESCPYQGYPPDDDDDDDPMEGDDAWGNEPIDDLLGNRPDDRRVPLLLEERLKKNEEPKEKTVKTKPLSPGM